MLVTVRCNITSHWLVTKRTSIFGNHVQGVETVDGLGLADAIDTNDTLIPKVNWVNRQNACNLFVRTS